MYIFVSTPPGFLPDAGGDVDGAEHRSLVDKVDAGAEDQVDETARGAQKDAQHAADDHGGDKVRRVQHGLHHALELLEAQLVERQRQDDRHREAPQQAVQADEHRVDDHAAAVGRGEEPLEPFETDPLAAPDAAAGLEIAEGDLDAVHGAVLVHNGDDDRDQQQKIQLPVFFQPRFQRLAVHEGRVFARFCLGGRRSVAHAISSFIKQCGVRVYPIHQKRRGFSGSTPGTDKRASGSLCS